MPAEHGTVSPDAVLDLADLQVRPADEARNRWPRRSGGSSGRRTAAAASGDGSRPVGWPRGAAGPLIAEGVGYSRGGRDILQAVTMRAEPGRATAVTGPSGSGKSSLLALLAGLEQPDSGRVQPPAGARVGLVLQGYGLVSVLTAAENVEIALQSLPGRLAPAIIRERAAAVLEQVGLAEVADHLIEELSGGQQQRVAVARALVIEPSVLLADELTAELDHDWKQRVVDLVLDVAAHGGVVVMATHDPEIADRCAESVHLVDGRVARPGSKAG